jgi:hypothetical protein
VPDEVPPKVLKVILEVERDSDGSNVEEGITGLDLVLTKIVTLHLQVGDELNLDQEIVIDKSAELPLTMNVVSRIKILAIVEGEYVPPPPKPQPKPGRYLDE